MLVKYLVMTFITESGEKASLSVNGIKEDLTAEETAAAMDVIIAKNAFITKSGDLMIICQVNLLLRFVLWISINALC